MGSFTNDVIGLGGGGFSNYDDGVGVFAKDDVIFCNHFRSIFASFTTKFG